MVQHDFKLPPTLSDEEIAVILDKLDDLISWAGDVKEYALNAALHGTRFHGWKLVEADRTAGTPMKLLWHRSSAKQGATPTSTSCSA